MDIIEEKDKVIIQLLREARKMKETILLNNTVSQGRNPAIDKPLWQKNIEIEEVIKRINNNIFKNQQIIEQLNKELSILNNDKNILLNKLELNNYLMFNKND